MVGQFKKVYLHRPIKILYFLTPARIQKFNITSKYFSFFNNKTPASWVAQITRDFLTCYSCSYYSSMGTVSNIIKISHHSRLFLVLHLLVNNVIAIATARKTVEGVFILIQFFSYWENKGDCLPVHDSVFDKK